MTQSELKEKFTPEFFEEFVSEPYFRQIFYAMMNGATPYQIIEHLCKSQKAINETIENVLANTPRKIVVTTERFEELKEEMAIKNTITKEKVLEKISFVSSKRIEYISIQKALSVIEDYVRSQEVFSYAEIKGFIKQQQDGKLGGQCCCPRGIKIFRTRIIQSRAGG